MEDQIIIKQLRLWAHVGVLDWEREHGQWFSLNLQLFCDLGAVSLSDDIDETINYVKVIEVIRGLADSLVCYTIENFVEQIFTAIEVAFGPIKMELELTKCEAPIPGFSGSVSVRRKRN
jgi:dihydroneopterin aldolase